MSFLQEEDNCWHWSYEKKYNKANGRYYRNAWILGCIAMLIGLYIANPGLNHLLFNLILMVGVSLFVALILFLIWLPEYLEHEICSFSADETCFYMHRGNSRFSHKYDRVASLRKCRKANSIEIKIPGSNKSGRPLIVFAADEDYELVWDFFKDHCHGAKIIES